MEENREMNELLKKCDETRRLIEEAQRMCEDLLEELEEEREFRDGEDEPEEDKDPADDADWIIIF